MGFTNIEIKARCANQEAIRVYLKSHGADFKGTDHQIDTYFTVPNGRLKLREGGIENALIYYDRPNRQGPKQADGALYSSEPGSSLKDVLTKALGIKVIVDKRREIYFISNVKFHVDTVEGLGNFVEIEAIDTDGSLGVEELNEQCQKYLKELAINDSDLISVSYSDLLLQRA